LVRSVSRRDSAACESKKTWPPSLRLEPSTASEPGEAVRDLVGEQEAQASCPESGVKR
jgi:hypothetical protein